ncbi:ABC transporter permease [Catellatospora vulcania]|uniref:ABC transporter permease n=1 Tax=Catellatospora vulcania TaxID=1460450 RepID=UPI0012D3E58D|nr:ABC transporter permease [Catellatospora vulcania]
MRERLGETALLGVLAALVVAVGVAGPLYADAAARNVLAASAASATPAEQSLTVTVEMTSRNGFAAALAELRGSIAVVPAGPGVREIRGGYRRGAVTPQGSGTPIEVLLAARDDVCAHLALTGACPAQPGEVALAATTARRLGLAAGDTFAFQVQPTAPAAMLRITGVYDVDGAGGGLTDPYWAGRRELTPVPLRAENPVFTVPDTLQTLGADTFQATLDHVADLTVMSPDDVDALAWTLRVADEPGRGIAVTGGLRRLLPQIIADRDTVAVPVVTGAVLLLGVAWWVLLLGAGHAAAERRTQAVLGALRGAPARHRAALTAGPGVLTVLVALPVGLLLGRWLAQLLAWATMDAAGPVPLSVTALAVAGGLTLAVLVSVVIAQVRVHRGGVLDALRQVPARRGAAGGIAVVVVVVLAVAATWQLRNGDAEVLGLAGTVLPAAAPVLILVAAGLVAARAVRPLAGLLGRAGLRSGRVGTALGALYASRRPGMDRLVALVIIVMALLGQAAYGWQALQAAEQEQARLALGAAEVVRVRAPSRAALQHLVRQADPAGDWAMAVARQESSTGTTVAVDTTRLARVAYWPAEAGVAADRVASQLRPAANPSVRITGAALLLDLTVPDTVLVDQPLTAVLDGPGGEAVTATGALVPGWGRHTLRLDVPSCAGGTGCRLAWLSFRFDPAGVVLHSVGQAAPDAVVADTAAMTDPARWRTTVGAAGVTLSPLPGGLSVDYEPVDPRFPDPEVRVQVADVPLPVPAALAGEARLAHDRTVVRGEMLSPLRRPVDVVAAVPALPGAGTQGLLVDLEYADRAGDSTDNVADLQVWLAADAPADALDRLRATGLVPVSTETAVQRTEHLLAVGQGPGARFRFGAALLAVLLVLVAVALVVAVDGPRRGAELAALRTQGVPQRAVRRATRSGYLLIVAAAAAGGGLLGAAVADDSPASPVLPVTVLAVAGLLLTATAYAVGTRLSRVSGLDLEDGR